MATSVAPAPAQQRFKAVKHVTLPLLKMENDGTYYLKFISPIFQSEAAKVTNPEKLNTDGTLISGGNKKKPPELAQVDDLERNQKCQIIVNTVLGSELRKAYPGDEYVGKSFEIIRHKLPGRDYATFEITEIELQDEAPVEQSTKGHRR